MEICYDGSMVMPSNYAVINNDEMEYIEGGYYISVDSCNAIAAICAGASVLAGCVGDIVGIIALVDQEIISKSASIVIYAVCAAVKLFSGAASAFFWYASARGGITLGWCSFKFGK